MKGQIKFFQTIGEKIKNARSKLGLTQAQVASLIKIDLRRYQKIEYGKANITLKTYYEIQKFFSFRDTFIGESFPFEKQLICCITNHDGEITWVNENWQTFSRENNGPVDVIGQNYFQVIQEAKLKNVAKAELLSENLNKIQKELITQFELDYTCHHESEHRWFTLFCKKISNDQLLFIHIRYA